jgi:hypothetical protein
MLSRYNACWFYDFPYKHSLRYLSEVVAFCEGNHPEAIMFWSQIGVLFVVISCYG